MASKTALEHPNRAQCRPRETPKTAFHNGWGEHMVRQLGRVLVATLGHMGGTKRQGAAVIRRR
eukprot:8546878-Pyramimonas_sp.AAC.1